MLGRLLCLSALLVVGGCAAPLKTTELASSSGGLPSPRVVIGLVDSGINPYHPQFFDGTPGVPADMVDASTGEAPVPIRLHREGTYEEGVAADSEVWASLESGRLYWFEGTRILARSVLPPSKTPLILDSHVLGHGTAVASAARNVSREAWLVLVQLDVSFPGEENPFSGLEQAAQGVEWLARQPWVDIVSLSLGFPLEPPLLWEAMGYTGATQAAAESGKVVVTSAGNFPIPAFHGGTMGPPWMIAVGGVEASTHGEDVVSRKGVDVVSDMTRWVAESRSYGYRNASGTSVAAPVVAGVLAEGLRQLRAQAEDASSRRVGALCDCGGVMVSAGDLREALNLSAAYWGMTEYEPLNYSSDPYEVLLHATVPVLPAPWVQMGWGYVGQDSWQSIVRHFQDGPLPSKTEEARAYMAQQQALREAYWSVQPRLGPGGPDSPESPS